MNRSQIALTAAFVVGALVWALAPLVIDKREAWDSGLYYAGTLAVSAFVIALACFQWKEVIGGMFFGQILYLASFPRALAGEFNLIVACLGLMMAMIVPAAAAVAGWAIRGGVMKLGRRPRDE